MLVQILLPDSFSCSSILLPAFYATDNAIYALLQISNTNNSMGSVEVFHEKHLIPLISSIPKLSIRVGDAWRSRILKVG